MDSYNDFSDKQLLCRIQEADEAAFNALYDRYAPLLYVYARKIISKREDAEDVIQEIFVDLWNRKDINIHTSVSSYLYTAVRYKLFDLMDKDTVRKGYMQSLQTYMDEGDWTTDRYILEKELATQIEKEIDRLPRKMREIFLLSRRGNQSYQEIAQQLQLSDKTIKKQISNALKILRVRLTSFMSLLLFVLLRIFSVLF